MYVLHDARTSKDSNLSRSTAWSAQIFIQYYKVNHTTRIISIGIGNSSNTASRNHPTTVTTKTITYAPRQVIYSQNTLPPNYIPGT